MATREWWLMDERGLDPDQFDEATVYATALTLAEAKADQAEAGCGVIIEVDVDDAALATWSGVAA
jgi:hypothetical protein